MYQARATRETKSALKYYLSDEINRSGVRKYC